MMDDKRYLAEAARIGRMQVGKVIKIERRPMWPGSPWSFDQLVPDPAPLPLRQLVDEIANEDIRPAA